MAPRRFYSANSASDFEASKAGWDAGRGDGRATCRPRPRLAFSAERLQSARRVRVEMAVSRPKRGSPDNEKVAEKEPLSAAGRRGRVECALAGLRAVLGPKGRLRWHTHSLNEK